MATTAHACGELRHHPRDAVLAALEDHAQQFSSDYTCADWSALIQSFTRLYAKPHRLYPLLLQEVGSPYVPPHLPMMLVCAPGGGSCIQLHVS